MAQSHTSPSRDSHRRRWTSFSGLFFDEFASDSAWLREKAWVRLPPLDGVTQLRIRGECLAHPEARGIEASLPALRCALRGGESTTIRAESAGAWETTLNLGDATTPRGVELRFTLLGVAWTNFLAWLGRITGFASLQRFRRQHKNRQLRIHRIETETGEAIYDFSNRLAPYSVAFARRHRPLGLNIVGFLTADLGIGESARCMVRAADAAGLQTTLVPLKLHCKNRLGDQAYAPRLQENNPHEVNVVHLDPPAARDLDHHHGPSLRAGKYNIAYWAWELPDFPDSWVPSTDYFHEIWCPSRFTRDAIAMKSPLPVLTMPHAISFPRPSGNFRPRFRLPQDRFLFLFAFDLNSYAPRKNAQAVIRAFRASGLAGKGAALVIKVQNASANPKEFAELEAAVADLPGTVLIAETLSREEVYQLEAACDCFVSLHRAEGFGLAVAECMYLGKPVISTDWSATAEFVTAKTGCPVNCKLVTLQENHGPYMKGSTWAEPDAEHAGWWMQQLFEDRTLAATRGKAAQHAIETLFSPAIIGARYRERLGSIAGF